jgi:sulfonate transport system ATP-binding protein
MATEISPALALSSAPLALQLAGLRRTFGERAVLPGLDLRVTQGEVVAIVGRSGCGKSTLLRLLAGLDRADGGTLAVEGTPLHGLNRRARLMFQDAALLPWRTVLANVALAVPDRDPARARAALAQVGLADRAAEWPGILSGGQRQRVSLARALASGTSLLLLDEPLGALDALTRLEMQQLLERLWTELRFTMILITHDVDEALALADRVLVMEAGRFVLDERVDWERPRRRTEPRFLEQRERILASVTRRLGG